MNYLPSCSVMHAFVVQPAINSLRANSYVRNTAILVVSAATSALLNIEFLKTEGVLNFRDSLIEKAANLNPFNFLSQKDSEFIIHSTAAAVATLAFASLAQLNLAWGYTLALSLIASSFVYSILDTIKKN